MLEPRATSVRKLSCFGLTRRDPPPLSFRCAGAWAHLGQHPLGVSVLSLLSCRLPPSGRAALHAMERAAALSRTLARPLIHHL